jgi:hypothetical protein
MAQPYPTKDIVNTIYHSAVTTTLAVAYAVLGRKLIKLDVGDPSRPKSTDVVKLTLAITAGEITKEGLIRYKIIPSDILSK